jgi:hypothetical protein
MTMILTRLMVASSGTKPNLFRAILVALIGRVNGLKVCKHQVTNTLKMTRRAAERGSLLAVMVKSGERDHHSLLRHNLEHEFRRIGGPGAVYFKTAAVN